MHSLPDGTAPHPGIAVNSDGCEGGDLAVCGAPLVTATGEVGWDELVAFAVANEWAGLESLSGIAGSVADATAHNRGGYGVHVSDSVARVRTWDREVDRQRTFPLVDCRFEPDGSRFLDRMPDGDLRYRILDVALLLRLGDLTAPITDRELALVLDVPIGGRAPLLQVRDRLLRSRSLSGRRAPSRHPRA